MEIKDKKFEIFIGGKVIEKRVKEMASQISSDYQEQDPIIIPILNGAFLFASDLIKELTIPCEVTFVKTRSYQGVESTGVLKKLLGLDLNIKGRNIILVDDIVDTGLTIHSVLEDIKKESPSSIKIATLLLKPEALQKQLELKYVGFTIPNNFVVGYGLDYEGHGRNLKDIYNLKN